MAGNSKKIATNKLPTRFIASVSFVCFVSVFLLGARVASSDSMRYVFLLWNLVLAALPLLIAIWLVDRIKKYGWLAWQQIVLTILFLIFLPNSFYLVTDFVHLRLTSEATIIYDVVLLSSFMFSGLLLGYVSVYLMHRELKKRVSEKTALAIVSGLFLAVSFAIYLGRFSRWNTWDVLLEPTGLLFDVSDRFVNPGVHTDTYITTGIVFILLFGLYWVVYEGLSLVRDP
jgi:uncharacterized membrane protein